MIHEAHIRGTEVMSVKEILSQSSNIGTITDRREARLRASSPRWIDRFGFGRPTGIDYPGESSGLVLPLEDWSGSTIGTVPIGQGIAVTPLQMVSAYATIGNGGVRVTPHLVEKVGSKRVRGRKGTRVVSRHTADRMMSMFRDVVLEGTGTEAAIPGYTVAGKTGTAAEGRERALRDEVRRLVRRPRAREEAAARDPRDGGRAAREHLRRRRRGAGLPRHRPVRAPVPRGAARRARDEGVADGGRRALEPVARRAPARAVGSGSTAAPP